MVGNSGRASAAMRYFPRSGLPTPCTVLNIVQNDGRTFDERRVV